MNIVIVSGNACRDAEAKVSTKSGKPFTVFRLAVDGGYRGAGIPHETDFITCMCFGKSGETLHRTVKKGMRIAIIGKLKTYDRIDQFGSKRQETVIKVVTYEWVDLRRDTNPLEDLADSEGEYLIPREITRSLLRQIDATDEDIPEI